MRRWVAVCGLALLGGPAWGQSGATTTGAGMPGTPVGSGLNLTPIGTRQKAVGSAAGNQIGSGVGGTATTPQDFSKVDRSLLAAPLPEQAGVTTPLSFWQRLADKVKPYFGGQGTKVPRPNYVPSISRRNRERAEERMWRRD